MQNSTWHIAITQYIFVMGGKEALGFYPERLLMSGLPLEERLPSQFEVNLKKHEEIIV